MTVSIQPAKFDTAFLSGTVGVSEASPPRLVVADLSHDFRRQRVLHDINLSVRPGEILVLVGPSGCGKSTLLRLIAGIEPVRHGIVQRDGQIVAAGLAHGRVHCPPERRDIGLVFQDYALFPHMDVLANVCFGLNHLPKIKRVSVARDMLAQVGLSDFAARYPHELSGGQQQRVALARAMAPSPGVLLLDEPFSGLDSRLRAQVRDDTLHVLKESGAAVILVTHDPEEALFLADQIVLMRDGRIVQNDMPGQIYRQPVDDFAAGFFGAVNIFTADVHEGRIRLPFQATFPVSLPDQTMVTAVVRPEYLRLMPVCSTDPGAEAGIVSAVRMVGRFCFIHVDYRDAQGHIHHIHARLPGNPSVIEGQPVRLCLDPYDLLVFPAK